MMYKIKTLLFLVMMLNTPVLIFGQGNFQDSLLKARILLNDYRDASKFENAIGGGFDPSWKNIFRNCFNTDKIIFDVPLKFDAGTVNSKSTLIAPVFQQFVTIDQYIDTLQKAYQRLNIKRFDYGFTESGMDASTLSKGNKIVFEIQKIFGDTYWSLPDSRKYLVEIRFFDGEPKITNIRAKIENFAKNEVVINLVDSISGKKKKKSEDILLNGLVTRIKIDFEENINDRIIIDKSDSRGKINLGLIANRATIFIDSVYSLNGVKYSIPYNWKAQGYKASQQPVEGYIVQLNPFIWKGFSYSVSGFGGAIVQSANDLQNFSSNESFTNNVGYKLGAGFDVAYFFNSEKWNVLTRNWIYGVGLGFSVSYSKWNITSNNFSQKSYDFVDRSGDPCQILFNGSSFDEKITSTAFSIPVYGEVRKKFTDTFLGMRAFSLQAGANFLIPVQSRFEASGTFSRHGLYSIYDYQIITDDSFYNYYTNRQKSYSGPLDFYTVIGEGQVKLTGFLDVFKSNPDNSLTVSLLASFPFSPVTSSETSSYFISTGNDETNSLMYSKKKIYDYFFGISVGVNFIKYRVE